MIRLSFISFFLLVSCSTLEFDSNANIDVTSLVPEQMATQLPIIQVTVDPQDFQNIYDDFKSEIVVPATVTWWSSNKEELLKNEPTSLEIKGSGSSKYVLKSLGFIFEEDLNNDSLALLRPALVNDEHSLSRFKSLRLRNSGSDFFFTMFKDLAYHEMALRIDLDVALQYGQPAHCFINDNYYGLLNIRTETNVEGISRLVDIPQENLTLMEVDSDNGNLEYREGNEELANRLINALKTDDAFTLIELVDINSFIDYIVFEDFVGNSDWPQNNCKAYSKNGEPFKFILFDLDRAADRAGHFLLPEMESTNDDLALIYQSLIKLPEFVEKLEKRQAQIFELAREEMFTDITNAYEQRIITDMDYQIARYTVPPTKMIWHLNVDQIQRNFQQRYKLASKKYDLD